MSDADNTGLLINAPDIVARLPVLVGGRLPVDIPAGASGLTNAELRATPVPVSGTLSVSGGLTNTELRASPVPVTVSGTVAVSGGLTDAQLRASAVPVSGVFFPPTQPVSGPLTNTEIRATALPVSGTFFQTVQPVSVSSLPLPSGAATNATLATLATDAGQQSVFTRLGDGTQRVQVDSLPSGLSTSALQTSGNASLVTMDSSLSVISARTPVLGQALMAASTPVVIASNQGAIPVSGTFFQATQPVSVSSLPLPSGAATETTLGTVASRLPATIGPMPAAGSLCIVVANDQAPIPIRGTDTNRVRCVFTFQAVAPAIADTLLTVTKNLNGVITTATSHAVTAGKRLRVTHVSFSLKSGAAAAAFATMTLRTLQGTVLVGSPSILRVDLGNTAALIGAAAPSYFADVPDGLEFSGTDQIGVSLSAQAVTNIISISLIGYEYTP
jgi:hypothetical protein